MATTGIVIAAIANTIVKAGIASWPGTKRCGAAVTGGLALTSLAGVALLVFV